MSVKGFALGVVAVAVVGMANGHMGVESGSGDSSGGSSGTGADSGGGNSGNRKLGKHLAAEKGWDSAQWTCLNTLWDHESGWSASAHNSSGAHGIPQALPGSKMSSAGADWATNPKTQIKWGLGYIEDKYGTPCDAWAWWQRTDPRPYPGHWY